ncbi:unnamed protein product [Effrenium voratum]|nr:unnamed protein product [Effrenium voratum]
MLWSCFAAVAAAAHGGSTGCQCSEDWEQVRWEMWQIFRPDLDIPRLLACQSAPADCEDDTGAGLLGGAMPCSAEVLPTVTSVVPCAAGMMHYMLACALQMWLKGHYRQSALYYDHGLGFLALTKGCLDGSYWPLWTGQVLRNWKSFLAAAFPASAIVSEERQTGSSSYWSAGPRVQRNSSWWATGLRMGSYCPPEGDHLEGLREPQGEASSVLCAIPLVWPGEERAATVIAGTYATACDRLVFFLASPDAATAAEARRVLGGLLPGASVVDLAAEWPAMLRDRAEALAAHGRQGVSGANQKDLLLFAHLASEANLEDWICRVETDSYFAPANFRRFVRGRQLSPEEDVYLGSLAYWHLHFEPRMVFNEQVQCLSRAATLRLGPAVRRAPWAETASYARCEVAPGHRGDIMLGLCLAEVGIVPFADVADRWGREYFLNYRMEDMALHAPYKAYGDLMPDPRHIESKAHIFMPCLASNQFWASPYPISFHDYKDADRLRHVHKVMLGQASCSGCPAGYEAKLARKESRSVSD